jgi:ribosomal protein S27E
MTFLVCAVCGRDLVGPTLIHVQGAPQVEESLPRAMEPDTGRGIRVAGTDHATTRVVCRECAPSYGATAPVDDAPGR